MTQPEHSTIALPERTHIELNQHQHRNGMASCNNGGFIGSDNINTEYADFEVG